MPIPKRGKESKKAFMNRCMSDPVMLKEFKDQSQRAAICYRQARKMKKAKAEDESKASADDENELLDGTWEDSEFKQNGWTVD